LEIGFRNYKDWQLIAYKKGFTSNYKDSPEILFFEKIGFL